MLDAHATIFCFRGLGLFSSFGFVVDFWVFIDWSHLNILHTHHDSRRPPHDFSFLSFPGTIFPGFVAMDELSSIVTDFYWRTPWRRSVYNLRSVFRRGNTVMPHSYNVLGYIRILWRMDAYICSIYGSVPGSSSLRRIAWHSRQVSSLRCIWVASDSVLCRACNRYW